MISILAIAAPSGEVSDLHRDADLHSQAYGIPCQKYSSHGVLKLLLDPQIDKERICGVWPISDIVSSSMFIVDITKLKHPDDVKKDFFGKWIHSGSHTFNFKASFDEDGSVFIEKCSRGAHGNVFYLRKLHSYHPSNSNFRRLLAFVSGRSIGQDYIGKEGGEGGKLG